MFQEVARLDPRTLRSLDAIHLAAVLDLDGGPMTNQVQVRRIYDEPADDDGLRVLVDRLWPRGVSKAAAALDEWARDVAPSDGLRQWYDHDVDRFDRFRDRYLAELATGEQATELDRIAGVAAEGTVTLLTATRNVEHSHAVVLAEAIRSPH